MSKTFVITGASRGLGLELTKQLSAKGHIVIACARSPEKSEKLQSLVDGKKVFSVTLDTVDTESVKTAAQSVAKIVTDGIDVLINNAGIMTTGPNVKKTDVLSSSPTEYQRLFDTNVVGTVNVIQAFVPLLRQKSVRQIFNVTSILGSMQSSPTTLDVDSPYCRGGFAPYCISKAAENMVTRATSAQLASEGFTVVSIHPGWVKTDMGTQEASVEIVDSIKGMVKVIENVTQKDTGSFYDYEGNTIAW